MEATSAQQTVAQVLGWAKDMLDYTDQVCEDLTDDNLSLRPTDAKDGYYFSAGEQVMHIADSRWHVIGWLEGNDYEERKFGGKYPGKDKPWPFKDASRDEVVAAMKDSRAKLDVIMAQPATALLEPTAGTIKAFEEAVAKAKEKGEDTAELEASGPDLLANSLMFLVSHEQAHRGVLQNILRMHGEDVMRVA